MNQRTFMPLAAASLLATMAASTLRAQGGGSAPAEPPLQRLEFAVEAARDFNHRLSNDQVLQLAIGQRLRLRAELVPTPRGGLTAATYRLLVGRDLFDILSEDEARGEITLQGKKEGTGFLAYEITYPGVRSVLKRGRLEIHVGETTDDQADQPVAATPASTLQAKADEVVRGLYRGILLRDPDPAGAGYADQIRRSGWMALESVARTIADSEESRKNVYAQPGVGDPQRLLALHRELLGRSQQDISMDEWDYQLNLFAARRYADVVTELVRHPEFRRHFGIVAY